MSRKTRSELWYWGIAVTVFAAFSACGPPSCNMPIGQRDAGEWHQPRPQVQDPRRMNDAPVVPPQDRPAAGSVPGTIPPSPPAPGLAIPPAPPASAAPGSNRP
jgi:hypothetical protein